jgi:hypothetical protein
MQYQREETNKLGEGTKKGVASFGARSVRRHLHILTHYFITIYLKITERRAERDLRDEGAPSLSAPLFKWMKTDLIVFPVL